MKKENRTDSTNHPFTTARPRRKAVNEARYDELLDRAMRRRRYEKRYGRDD